ncbi:helix-turn-helix domain-containing protein [Vagococcus sp. JNUCC 83]
MLIIGKNIKTYRIKESLTQTELAEIVGVSKSSVSKWETNQTYPDIDLLPKLATIFGISIDELIGYQQSMKKEAIQTLYNIYSKRFSLEPFDQVYEDCVGTIIHIMQVQKCYYK